VVVGGIVVVVVVVVVVVAFVVVVVVVPTQVDSFKSSKCLIFMQNLKKNDNFNLFLSNKHN